MLGGFFTLPAHASRPGHPQTTRPQRFPFPSAFRAGRGRSDADAAAQGAGNEERIGGGSRCGQLQVHQLTPQFRVCLDLLLDHGLSRALCGWVLRGLVQRGEGRPPRSVEAGRARKPPAVQPALRTLATPCRHRTSRRKGTTPPPTPHTLGTRPHRPRDLRIRDAVLEQLDCPNTTRLRQLRPRQRRKGEAGNRGGRLISHPDSLPPTRPPHPPDLRKDQ